jgi:hypothetical protein
MVYCPVAFLIRILDIGWNAQHTMVAGKVFR